MSGFFRNPRAGALAAALLALAGAASWGPSWARGDAPIVLVDRSPSSDARAPEGARTFAHSDLMRAVREAGGPRVRLLTDGCDVTGKPASDPGFPVDVELAGRRDHTRVESVSAPPRAGVRESFGVRVAVGRTAGETGSEHAFAVVLEREGRRVGSPRSVRLRRGERRVLTFVDSIEKSGIFRYEARLSGERGPAASAFVRVGAEPRIGVAGAVPPWEGFVFEAIRADVPYDAFLVTESVSDPVRRASLATQVRAGAGLLAIGAVDAPLLPLTETPPQGRAVVVLLDVSGSMEPHLAALRQGFFELCARLDPDDLVALVRFRSGVVDESEWRPARDAASLWRSVAARGNTELEPAWRRALTLLAGSPARHRRIYVVSDGAWESIAALAAPEVHRAALFVVDDPPASARALFPLHARGAGALTTALRALEEQAPDRWVRAPVVGHPGDVAAWLRGALAPGASFENFPRLYPRGLDERVALLAGDVPLVASREEGGRIVQAVRGTPALLRATLADATIRLAAWRDGRALRLEARGGAGEPFRVGERSIPARACGTAAYQGTLDPAPPGPLVVRCGGASTAVPALSDAEQAGLFPDESYARALARASGGSFGPDAASNRSRRRAVHATLLLAAVLVLGSAFLRRR